jgi:hypothetical protein
LKKAHPDAELRSLRATALVFLAVSDVPEETIKKVADHQSVTTTRRYLRHGLVDLQASSQRSQLPTIL